MRSIVTARTRTQIGSFPVHTLTKQRFTLGGGPYTGWPKSGAIQSKSMTTKDTSTPGFKKLQGKGMVFCKDYQNTTVTTYSPLGTYTQDQPINGTWTKFMFYNCRLIDMIPFGNLPIPPTPSATNIDSESALLMQHTRAKVDASDVQSLVILAEMNKIPGTFRGIALSIVKLIVTCFGKEKALYAKYGLKNPKRFAIEVSRLWLAARFGLRPLYYDTVSIIRYLQSLDKRPERITYRSRVIRTDPSASWINGSKVGTEGYFTSQTSSTRMVDLSAGITVQPSWDIDTKQRAQGLTEIPEALWELVPFSFLVDWFVNVGETIAALTPEFDVIELASWLTVEENVTKNYILTGCTLSKEATACRGSMDGFSHTITTRTRTRYANPAGSFIPHCKVRLNWAKAIDASALVPTIISKILKMRVHLGYGKGLNW
jgi:hypothetical protein